MRTTVDIPEDLLQEAIKVSHVKTKTMAIVLGLKEIINRAKIEKLRHLGGRVDLKVDIKKSRKR